jgi:glycosyltransferase involved in cell wall biosynthesis
MRLAVVGPVYPFRGGIAHYTTLLTTTLTELEHTVLLVSFRRQYPRWLFPGASDRDPSRAPLTMPIAQYWLDSLNPFTWLATFWRIRRFRPQRLVLQWWTSFWAPVWLTLAWLNWLFLRVPLVMICHNVLPHDARPWTRWITWLVLHQADQFIVQSEQEAQRLRSLLARSDQQLDVQVVPHPVYDMFADQRQSRAEARRSLGLPVDVPVLLFFGIVRPYKGLRDLICALPQVVQQHPDLRLLIAGEFWEPLREYQDLIEQLHLRHHVQIDNRYVPNEEIGRYFSAADRLVAPYRRQTASGAIEMARGFGLPVITLPPDAPEQGEARHTLLVETILASLATPAAGSGEESPRQRKNEHSWRQLAEALVGVAQ